MELGMVGTSINQLKADSLGLLSTESTATLTHLNKGYGFPPFQLTLHTHTHTDHIAHAQTQFIVLSHVHA